MTKRALFVLLGVLALTGCASAQTVGRIGTSLPAPPLVPPTSPTLNCPAATGGVQGFAYSSTFTATGGSPPYLSYAITAGSLPVGLSLTAGTGLIAGTPSVVATYNFTGRVTDTAGQSNTRDCSIVIGAPASFTSHPRLFLTTAKLAEVDAKISGVHADYTAMKSTLDQVINDNPYFGIVTALSGGIDASTTTIVVTNGAVLPSANFYIRVDLELIYCRTRATNTLSNCHRGEPFLFWSPSIAATHSNGAEVWKGQSDETGVSSTLSGNINATDLTFSVASGASFDASGYLRIENERMHYVRSGNNFTIDDPSYRGYNYTTATSHTLGATVYKDHGGLLPASGWAPLVGSAALLRHRGVAAYTALKARGMLNTLACILAVKVGSTSTPMYTNQDYFRWYGPPIAEAYDWLYASGDLSANEKAYYAEWMRNAVIEHQWPLASQSITGGNPKEWYQVQIVGTLNSIETAMTSNAASGAVYTSLLMSAATYGDNADATSQWNKAMTKVINWIMPAISAGGPAAGGLLVEGNEYQGESLDFLAALALIIKSATNDSTYMAATEAWAPKVIEYLLQSTLPGSSRTATLTTGSMTVGTPTLTVASASGWAVGDLLRIYNIDAGSGLPGDVYESVIMNIAGTTFTMRDNALTTFSGKDTFHIGRFFSVGDNNQDERNGYVDALMFSESPAAAYVMVDLLKSVNPTYAQYARYWLDNRANTTNQPVQKFRKFLHDDTTVTATDYSALPTMWGSTAASATGAVIARSGWTNTATFVRLWAGGNNFDHVHSHASSYDLRRKGVCLSCEINGYGADPDPGTSFFRGDSIYFGTKLHNAPLMNGHGPANSLNMNPEYNPNPVFMARADLNTSAGYAYARADLTPAYSSSVGGGFASWGYANNYSQTFIRDWLYVPAADLVVHHDKLTYSVATTSPTKWNFQFTGTLSAVGQRIASNWAGQEIVQDVVLPAAATLNGVDELAEFTAPFDYTSPPRIYSDYFKIPRTRVEVVSGVSATTEYGFSVIQLGDTGFTRLSVTSLTTTNADVVQVGTTFVFGFVKDVTPTLPFSYVVSGTPRNLVCGLAVSTAYHITRSVNTITFAVATGSGDTTSSVGGCVDLTL